MASAASILSGTLHVNQQRYRRLISGQARHPAACVARCFLTMASWLYAMAVVLRNRCYDRQSLKTYRVKAVVISIGNITTGGTGKTPLVIWLSRFLQKKQVPCAILTRGYSLKNGTLADEPAILAKSCPQAKLIVNPDRVAGAAEAVDKCAAKVLIMDDGFQHRRLHRDIDIVTIDATCPFGYGKLLPAGLLREPVTSLRRAHAAVITRADQVTQDRLTDIEKQLRKINPAIVTAAAKHAPACIRSLGPEEISFDQVRNKKVYAFCGLGNPGAFFQTINSLNLDLVGFRAYNDHHHYTEQCLRDIYEEARYLDAGMVLTTQKDWTKTALSLPYDDILFAYLTIELQFVAGGDQLIQLIEATLKDIILPN